MKVTEEERDLVINEAHVKWARLGGTASQDALEAAGLRRGTFLPRHMSVDMAVDLQRRDPDLLARLISAGSMEAGRRRVGSRERFVGKLGAAIASCPGRPLTEPLLTRPAPPRLKHSPAPPFTAATAGRNVLQGLHPSDPLRVDLEARATKDMSPEDRETWDAELPGVLSAEGRLRDNIDPIVHRGLARIGGWFNGGCGAGELL